MSRINFIKPVPRLKEKEIRIWYWLTGSIGTVLFLSIAIISTMQWYVYRTLFQKRAALSFQLNDYQQLLTQQKKDQTEYAQLRKQTTKMQRYRSDPKNPLTVLNGLRSATKSVQLQSVSISPNSIEFQISCPSAQHAATCIKQLNEYRINTKNLFTNVTLVSLSYTQQQVHATIKGTLMGKLTERI